MSVFKVGTFEKRILACHYTCHYNNNIFLDHTLEFTGHFQIKYTFGLHISLVRSEL